jgi:NADH-quinone oxidoreductase subunit J
VTVSELVFYLLGGLAVASSVLVITSRNPVASLLFLVLSFFCLAGLFATLEAHFIAAIQILIYAGAILVLFLFVIMLLNLGRGEPWGRLPRPLALALTGAAAAGFVLFMVLAFRQTPERLPETPSVLAAAEETTGPTPGGAAPARQTARRAASPEAGVVGSTEAVGVSLFRDFLLPFEVTSLLLLVAMVGAVMLAKRER